jgi:Fe-S cluster assembly protein SufD
MDIDEIYLRFFDYHYLMLCKHTAEVLNGPRAEAVAELNRQGFPTKRLESYRHTDVKSFFEPNYGLDVMRKIRPKNPYRQFKCSVPDISSSMYFVVNDIFFTGNGTPQNNLPEGVIFGGLRDMGKLHPELVKKYYSTLAKPAEDGLTAFNTAIVQDGIFLYIPKNTVIEQPIQIVNVIQSNVLFQANRRILVILEEGAQACLLSCDHCMDDVQSLVTQVTEVFVGPGAVFDFYEMEETNTRSARFNNMYVKLEKSGSMQHNTMTLHNGTTRNAKWITLAGEHAEVNLCGMIIADKQQHVDNQVCVDHAASNTTSRTLYKYALDGAAHGVFSGTVTTCPGVRKTSAKQLYRNLFNSPRARMYANPCLEVYSDNVWCGHGATTGQLDDKALFYMTTRGVTESDARRMLKIAFLLEVINDIRVKPLKDRLYQLIERRLSGELMKCKSCDPRNKNNENT